MSINQEILTRRVTNIIPNKQALDKLLTSGKKINVYLGVDPTATHIHLGTAVPLRKLQQFADLGHHVTFLIGDFTALIGDTSDKNTERPVLSYEQIQENFKTYKKQAEKIVDFSKVNVVFNSEWLKELSFEDIIKLCQHFSVGDFVGRELIRERLKAGKRVGLHETLYPVMQGYDSYFLDADIQIGGADQTFNMQAGRVLQKNLRGKESFILVTGYLEGTDGRKMSKSWGNAIWLDDSPTDMYGKIMSIKDELIITYFTLATNLQMEEINKEEQELKDGKNPMLIKAKLAWTIVKELHSSEEADKAKDHFEKTFQKKEPEFNQEIPPLDSLAITIAQVETVATISQAKRLIHSHAVEVNGIIIDNPKHELNTGDKIKIGERVFVKIK